MDTFTPRVLAIFWHVSAVSQPRRTYAGVVRIRCETNAVAGSPRTVPQRPRHPKKDLEEVFAQAEGQEWRVERGKKYYKLLCPCADKHLKTVKLTPSDPNYRTNLLKWLVRETCWKEA